MVVMIVIRNISLLLKMFLPSFVNLIPASQSVFWYPYRIVIAEEVSIVILAGSIPLCGRVQS